MNINDAPHRNPEKRVHSYSRSGWRVRKPVPTRKGKKGLIEVPPLGFRQDNLLRIKLGLGKRKPPFPPINYNTTKTVNTDDDNTNNTTMYKTSIRKPKKPSSSISSAKIQQQKSQATAVKMNSTIKSKLPSNANAAGVTKNIGDDDRHVIPASVTHDKKTLKLASNSETRVIHKTCYRTGFNPSKGVRDAAKIFGTYHQVLYDSKINTRNVFERNTMTVASGFNSKVLHIPNCRAQLCRNDVDLQIRSGFAGLPLLEQTVPDLKTKTYASILNLKRQYMIHNNSSFLPMKFKISLYKLVDTQGPARAEITTNDWLIPLQNAIIDNTDKAALDAAITVGTGTFQPNGAIPWIFQHGFAGVQTDNTNFNGRPYFQANLSLKGRGLKDSSAFRNAYDLVESFEKTIPPGDFWNFSHVHSCGGGIDLHTFANQNFTSPNSVFDPYTYMVTFESQGVLCEGVQVVTGGRDTYLGVSPSYFSYEYKSSAYYVKENQVSTTGSMNSGVSSFRVHRREYVTDPQFNTTIGSLRQEVFVLPENITTDTNTSTLGEMYIPIITATSSRNNISVPGNSVG